MRVEGEVVVGTEDGRRIDAGDAGLRTPGEQGRLVAGELLFDTPRVLKLQYGCASARGSQIGAQDFLISRIIAEYADRPFLDFGSSNAGDGVDLNAGLIGQKEGFGGRTVCHDFYALTA